MFKFRNTTANATDHHLTPLQVSFTSDLNVASALPNTLFLILNSFLGYLIPLKFRMLGSMLLIFLFFGVTTAFVQVDTDSYQQLFFGLTMITVVLMNIASAILSGGLFGLVGQFPSEYITAVVSGQSLGGIFAALTEIIALTLGASPQYSAFVYFIIGTVVMLISIQAYSVQSRTVFFKYFTRDRTADRETAAIEEDRRRLVEEENEEEEDEDDNGGTISERRPESKEPNFQRVFLLIWKYGLIEFCIFVVTISIYPAVTVLITSTGKGNGHLWNDVYFVTVVNYLVFNSGDYLGRILAGLLGWPTNRPNLLLFAALLRGLWIPLFMLCNAQPRGSLPVLIDSDILYILLMVVFSISNGYLANLSLICAPKQVREVEREMASSMMAAFLGVGLAFGSALSLILVKLL